MLVVGMGIAAAGSRGTLPASGGMMGDTSTARDAWTGNSTASGMMDSTSGLVGDTGASAGMMDSTSGMSGSIDMAAMHEQMMASMAGSVPAKVLARCDALHGRMMATGGSTSADHASHHPGTSSVG